MDWISAAVLGIVQGLTEFLPVSSSGHLVIGQKMFGIVHHDILFDVIVHVGTLLAVLLIYKNILIQIVQDSFQSLKKKEILPGLQLGIFVVVATIPTALIGLSFKDQFEALFSDMNAVAYCLLFTGCVLYAQKFLRSPNDEGGSLASLKLDKNLVAQFSYTKVLLIGLAQSMAIAPGVSRSGSTIAIALMLGIMGKNAALFSFLLAIPAILGATVLQLKDIQMANMETSPLIIGFLAAFISGYLGLKLILKVVDKQRLEWFSFYLWVLGLSLLLL